MYALGNPKCGPYAVGILSPNSEGFCLLWNFSSFFGVGGGFDFYSMLRSLVVCSLLDSFLVEIEVSFLESTTEAEPECLFCLSLQLFHYRSGLIGYLADTSSKSPVEQLLWL